MKSYIASALPNYDAWKTEPDRDPETYDETLEREDAAVWRADAEREEEV